MAVLDARESGARAGGPSFPLTHRLERLVWQVTWALLASWTPPPMHLWRRMLARIFGAKLGPEVRIYGTANIWYPSNLTMGAYAVLGPKANCYCMAAIEIGDYATISQGAHLCGGTHDVDDEYFQLIAKPIVIGPFAWVAAEAFVGPGVVMHEGAVLGARGVAMKDLAEWCVYAGNPARMVRERKHQSTAF